MKDPAATPSWPEDIPTELFPGHVNRAVRPDAGARMGSLASADGDTVTIAFHPSGWVRLLVARPDRLATILARPDLTRSDGRPLVLVNPEMGVLGIAHGPAEPQRVIEVLFCTRTEDGKAVAVMGVDGHPSWAVLRVKVLEEGDGRLAGAE